MSYIDDVKRGRLLPQLVFPPSCLSCGRRRPAQSCSLTGMPDRGSALFGATSPKVLLGLVSSFKSQLFPPCASPTVKRYQAYSVHFASRPLSSEIMAVNLDNIQFYHGPSRPARPPYFAFNSNKSASNTMLSGKEAIFLYVLDPSVADDSIIIPNCFLPLSANADDTTHQDVVGSPNLFDIELASSYGDLTPLSSTRDSGDGHACPSLQKFDCHH